jgi:hypothetical protein
MNEGKWRNRSKKDGSSSAKPNSPFFDAAGAASKNRIRNGDDPPPANGGTKMTGRMRLNSPIWSVNALKTEQY